MTTKFRATFDYQSWSACGQRTYTHEVFVAPSASEAEKAARDWFGSKVYGTLLDVEIKSVKETATHE